MPDNKRPTAPASRPKARPQGILSKVSAAADDYIRTRGMSPETKRWLGGDAKGPLGALNRTAIAAANLPVLGLSALGEGAEAVARKVDDVSRKAGLADRLSWQGNKFLPGSAGMALAEAFPMGHPVGSEVAVGNAVSQAARKARPALKAGGKLVREVAKDTRGEFTPIKPKAAPATGALSGERIKLTHHSRNPTLTHIDPKYVGTNRNAAGQAVTSREEVNAAKTATGGRAYFGVKTGEPGGYVTEKNLGPFKYEADVPADRYLRSDGESTAVPENYDRYLEKTDELRKDPDALRELNLPMAARRSVVNERLIQNDGYDGISYQPAWNKKYGSTMGEVLHHWGDPVPVSRVEKPLEGAPTRAKVNGEMQDFGPFDPLRDSTRKYVEDAGINYTPPTKYAPQDPQFGASTAQAYDEMPHDPFDPDVSEAYTALDDELGAQYQRLVDDGYKFSFHDPENNPYANPWEASQDVRDNRNLQVFPTDAGFGSGGEFPNNPLMDYVPDLQWPGPDGTMMPVRKNDRFRAVHDVIGHAKEGFGFRADGENAAYLQHLPTFSPPAQRALASETLGQNSMVNYGPNGEFNRTASGADTIYADQKAGLLPDDVIYGGQAADFMPDPRSTAYGKRGEFHARGDNVVQGRIRNSEGLQARFDELGIPDTPLKKVKHLERLQKEPVGAPAIIQSRPPRQPEWGYENRFTGLKNQPGYDDLGVRVEDTGMAPRTSVTPEDLYGSTLIAGQSDRTRAGGILTGIGKQDFEKPVKLEGGQDFMRASKGSGFTWASDPTLMKGVLKRANELEGDSIYAPFAMQGSSSDFSTMSSNAILEALRRAPLKARKAFDERIRSGVDPDFMGTAKLGNEAHEGMLRQQLNSKASLRVGMAKTLDKKEWQKQGLPQMGALRQAIAEPKLLTAPTETFGYSLGKIDKSRPVSTDPEFPHETYEGQVPGEYLGGLDIQVPANLMFPDFFDEAMARPNAKRSDISYMLKRGVKTQKADQQWLDDIMAYWEDAKSTGERNW